MKVTTTEQNWKRQSETVKENAQKLAPGPARDAMIKHARQLEIASDMSAWLSSSGLQSPT